MRPPALDVRAAQIVKYAPDGMAVADDPLAALQGKIAGLSGARAGSNPNENFTLRLRGNATLTGNNAPQIWLENVPLNDANLLITSELDSILVLKDAASAGAFGARAAPGILVAQLAPLRAERLRVGYAGEAGFSQNARQNAPLGAPEFVQRGGQNWGSQTAWMPLVFSDLAASHRHALRFSAGRRTLQWRAAFGYQKRAGTLRFSEHEQWSASVGLQWLAWRDRLTLRAHALARARRSDFSNPEATRYALTFNPTAPVRSDSAQYQAFGGYFQQANFEFFNPVALLEQNRSLGKMGSWAGILNADLRLSERWSASAAWSLQSSLSKRGEHSPANSFWRGLPREGFAMVSSSATTHHFAAATLRYEVSKGRARWNFIGKMTHQVQFFDQSSAAGGKVIYPNGAPGVRLLDDIFALNIGDVAAGDGLRFDVDSAVVNTGFQAETKLAIGDWLAASAGLRAEQSPALAAGKNRALLPFAQAAIDFAKWRNPLTINVLRAHLSWGVAANMPLILNIGQWGWGFAGWGWEHKTEFDFGLEAFWAKAGLWARADFFQSRASDLVVRADDFSQQNFQDASLRNRGWEVSLARRAGRKIRRETSLNLAGCRTKILSIGAAGAQEITSPGAPGNGAIFYHRLADGGQLGDIQALVATGLDAQGYPIFQDLNGNGSAFDPEDRAIVGNGAPRLTLGLGQQFWLKRWSLAFGLRGVLGHSLVHENRVFYEHGKPVEQHNILKTKYFEPAAGQSFFHDTHVEKANFWRLDRLRLAYRLPLGWPRTGGAAATLFVLAENLLTLTGYAGNDPEPRFGALPPTDSGAFNLPAPRPHPVALGIDRRGTYPLARAFSLGAAAEF